MTVPLVSVCLIARDEAHNLPQCLGSVRGLANEVIVVDTGSRDETETVARELGAIVYRDPWRDDFAYHRNTALSMATGTWCLVLDADERIVNTDFGETRARLAEDRDLPDVLLVRNRLLYPLGRETTILSPRLTRRSAGIRYKYALHEQLDVVDAPAAPTNLEVVHVGYVSPEAVVRKERRNLRIAESMVPGPHAWHCVARLAFFLQDFPKVIAAASQLLDSSAPAALKEEVCALAAASSLHRRDTASLTRFLAYEQAIAPESADLQLFAVVASLARYAHGLRDGDSRGSHAYFRRHMVDSEPCSRRSSCGSPRSRSSGSGWPSRSRRRR